VILLLLLDFPWSQPQSSFNASPFVALRKHANEMLRVAPSVVLN
jgi:hypothetical protein